MIKSVRLRPTGEYNEEDYEKFVAKQENVFLTKYHETPEEARRMAEETCSMYKHHFRVLKPVSEGGN